MQSLKAALCAFILHGHVGDLCLNKSGECLPSTYLLTWTGVLYNSNISLKMNIYYLISKVVPYLKYIQVSTYIVKYKLFDIR